MTEVNEKDKFLKDLDDKIGSLENTKIEQTKQIE